MMPFPVRKHAIWCFMDELLRKVGWSKVFFAQKLGVPERTVRGWCSSKTHGNGYRAAMAYLGLVDRMLG